MWGHFLLWTLISFSHLHILMWLNPVMCLTFRNSALWACVRLWAANGVAFFIVWHLSVCTNESLGEDLCARWMATDKSVVKVWIWELHMLTGCPWGTGYIWLWLSWILARSLACVIHWFSMTCVDSPCCGDWVCIPVSWRLPIDWWDLPRQLPSVIWTETAFTTKMRDSADVGGRSLKTHTESLDDFTHIPAFKIYPNHFSDCNDWIANND